MSQLAIFLLGSPRLELDGVPIEVNRRKALAVIAYLAVTGQGHGRDTLATLLWPEYDQSRARAALRRTLSVLNKALAGDWLAIDREMIDLIRNADLWIDVEQFQQQLTETSRDAALESDVCSERLTDLAEAVRLYRDDFLAGFTLRDSPPFDEWQFFQAENLRQALAGALERLVQGHRVQGDYEPALAHARAWLEIDPLNETIHTLLMELYAQTNQRTAALRQYQECIRILDEELGIPPSAETTALYERIRTGGLVPEKSTPRQAQIEMRQDHGLSQHTDGRNQSNGKQAKPGSQTTMLPSFLATMPRFLSTPSPFVAREPELAQLDHYLEDALAGQGQVVFITGEAGSGKTALIQAFARRAQEKVADLVVTIGNCDTYTGSGDPYLPFREILSLLAGDIESRWAQGIITQENARRLWELRSISIETLINFGPDLIGSFISRTMLTMATGQVEGVSAAQSFSEHQSPGDLVTNLAQSDLFEQFTHVLQALAKQQPLLLLIDDAQWADLASINLLFHLSRRLTGSPILIIITYRPDDVAVGRGGERHPLEAVVNEIKRTFGDTELDLGQAMGRHFVEAFLDVEPNRLGPEFRTALYQRTQGHPLFTVELLRDMQERGNIARDEQGRWVEGPALNWEILPGRVEAVIEERIGRLEAELRDNLTVASVVGETFTAQVVAQVQNISERDLLRALSQASERRHLLVRELCEIQVGSRFFSCYQFAHTMFQQYLYNSLSTGERRLLHGEIAATLESLYKEQLEEITVQLAHHYVEAGQTEQAIDYLLQAGDKARQLHAHQEAIDFYEQALSLLKEQGAHDRAGRTLMKLGLTHHLAFNFRQARQAYREGFTLWQRASMHQPTPPPLAPHPLRMTWTNPPTLDPTMAGDEASATIIVQIFSGLAALTPEMDVVPEIARSWDVLDGGRRYIFHLRDDVRWSDGAPVTAEDFVYAWRRSLNPTVGSPHAISLLDIKGARAFHQGQVSDPEQIALQALDAVTLIVELEEPASYFPQTLTRCQLFPVPRHVVEAHGEAWADAEHIVTNGAFIVERWEKGQSMVLRRNPEYRGYYTGNVEQVTLSLDMPAVARLEMYQDGRLDTLSLNRVAFEVDPIRQRYATEYLSNPMLCTQYICLNAERSPFDDPQVRRAFAMAIDKETLASVSLSGYDSPATGGFIPPGMPEHSPDIGLPYDPDQARRLLAEAGYPIGQKLPMIVCLGKPHHQVDYDYLQAQWQENLGVEIVFEVIEWGQLLDRLQEAPPHLFRMGWVADYPDPDNFLRVGIHYEDWAGWQHETYLELVEKARRITDQVERIKLYQQADKILVEEAVIVPLFYSQAHILLKPWISRFPTSPINWNFWKDVVIEPH